MDLRDLVESIFNQQDSQIEQSVGIEVLRRGILGDDIGAICDFLQSYSSPVSTDTPKVANIPTHSYGLVVTVGSWNDLSNNLTIIYKAGSNNYKLYKLCPAKSSKMDLYDYGDIRGDGLIKTELNIAQSVLFIWPKQDGDNFLKTLKSRTDVILN